MSPSIERTSVSPRLPLAGRTFGHGERKSHTVGRLRWMLFVLALALSHSVLAVDNAANLLVPFYDNPCCGDTQWPLINALANTQHARLGVIVTPTNGSLPTIDPNYVHNDGTGPLVDLINSGASVIGYVSICTISNMQYVRRPIADIEHDIDLYYMDSYWLGHHLRLRGIFFDLMLTDLNNVGFYQQLYAYVRNKDSAAWVVGNPGASGTTNSPFQTTYSVLDYAKVFDTLVVAEETEANFRSGYTDPSWVGQVLPAALAILVHTTPATASSMRADLSLALHHNAGWVYVTNDVPPNAYDVLPPYWTNEIAVLPELIFSTDFE